MATLVASGFACGNVAACGAFDADEAPKPLDPEGGASSDSGVDGATVDGSTDAASADAGAGPRADMVAVAGFFIDAHEATFAEYAAFVDALSSKSPPALPARCAFKTDFMPSACTDVAALPSQHPAACVDWCDAFAYCAFNGKRLCGKTGGGPVDPVLPLED